VKNIYLEKGTEHYKSLWFCNKENLASSRPQTPALAKLLISTETKIHD